MDEDGAEYWEARELMKALRYKEWRNFEKVIEKAKISVEITGNRIVDWVVDINKPIITGRWKKEIIKDYKLRRLFCYIIVQNGDSKKEEIALGQRYFAIQTRKAEFTEEYLKEYDNLSEDEKRLRRRNVIKKNNYELNRVARDAGVKNFGEFHNAGYKGLYNW